MRDFKMTRRQLLIASPLLWLAGAGEARPKGRSEKTLVCVCMRGALDGLSAVVPYTEPEYYELRPQIAVPPPGRQHGALRLDSRFALHPSLTPLLSLYQSKQLAIVNAVGSPHTTRSHFEAQDYLETGVPGDATLDGWLNRYLGLSPSPEAMRAVALSPEIPRALSGPAPVLAIHDLPDPASRARRSVNLSLEDFKGLYHGGTDAVRDVGYAAIEARMAVERRLAEAPPANHATKYPRSAEGFADLARLLKAGIDIEVAWIEFGGWDTHTGQRGPDSRLARHLSQFATGLKSFHAEMGPRMQNILILTMSEFGRTVAENGTLGTDHGHGTVMFLAGGGTRGGKVFGAWPGLSEAARHEGRDLAVTTDFRSVLIEVLAKHMGMPHPERLFNGFDTASQLDLIDAAA